MCNCVNHLLRLENSEPLLNELRKHYPGAKRHRDISFSTVHNKPFMNGLTTTQTTKISTTADVTIPVMLLFVPEYCPVCGQKVDSEVVETANKHRNIYSPLYVSMGIFNTYANNTNTEEQAEPVAAEEVPVLTEEMEQPTKNKRRKS